MSIQSPRVLERLLMRKLLRNSIFTTARGCINGATEIASDKLSIQTSKSVQPFSITRKSIREAICYFVACKSTTRKELQKFSNYTSSLLALLVRLFQDKIVIRKLRNKGIRISLKGIRFFPSGLERDKAVRQIVKEVGGHHLLLNYFHIRNNKGWKKILDEGFYCIIDSGAYSIFRYKQKQRKVANHQLELFNLDDVELVSLVSLEEYAEFINSNSTDDRILAFINLDVIGDPKKTRENFLWLKERCPKATIWPVYQITASLESLEELVKEEHQVICIGGLIPALKKGKEAVQKKLTTMIKKFPTVNFHCLGIANRILWNNPIFSSDSTAFLNARKSGKQRKIYLPTGERVTAPSSMSTIDIIKQNLKSLISLENIHGVNVTSLLKENIV